MKYNVAICSQKPSHPASCQCHSFVPDPSKNLRSLVSPILRSPITKHLPKTPPFTLIRYQILVNFYKQDYGGNPICNELINNKVCSMSIIDYSLNQCL